MVIIYIKIENIDRIEVFILRELVLVLNRWGEREREREIYCVVERNVGVNCSVWLMSEGYNGWLSSVG